MRWRHYKAVPQLDTWVSQKLCRKCEADSIGQDNIETLKIGVEPVTAVPPERCYQDLIVPPRSFTNQEFHFNEWPWTFLDHFQGQKEAIGIS